MRRPARPSLIALAFASIVIIATPSLSAADLPKLRHRFVVIAHRADHTHAHENTLPAIENAIAIGADFIEIDLRTTKDGKLVLMHDSTVNRMTDGTGKVADLTFEEIRKLHVMDGKRPEIPPAQVPTFQEVLTKTAGRIYIYLDFKQADRELTAAEIRKHNLTGQVIVYDGVGAVPAWRKAAPELPMIVTPPDDKCKAELIGAFIKSTGVEILDGDWSSYDQPTIKAALEAGAVAWPDIQGAGEGPERWDKAVEMGVGGLQTDKPGELIKWLEARNLR